jgi:hypothetical protein
LILGPVAPDRCRWVPMGRVFWRIDGELPGAIGTYREFPSPLILSPSDGEREFHPVCRMMNAEC